MYGMLYDPDVSASRVLMPHAARVRFQLRLSDGTLVPKTYDDAADDNRWVRGSLLDVTTAAPAYALPYCVYSTPVTSTSYWWSGSALAAKASYEARTVFTPGVSPLAMMQFAYIWTPARSDLGSPPPVNGPYPVGLRVRIEVYDPERRTPDPISVDEWLPVRWR
jgi:hypothetical protein